MRYEEEFPEVPIDSRDLKRIKDKDLYETVEEVFDTKTVMTIYELMRRRVIKRMNGVVNAGKEARVYLGYGYKDEELAVKIYLTSTAEFRRGILKYIMGDPRFRYVPNDTRKLIYLWTRKEYRNLKKMYDVGVSVPRPIAVLNNVLVMEFIGKNGVRAPLLKEIWQELSEEDLMYIYEQVIDNLKKIVCKAGLVHADFSEFNIMVKNDLSIVVIDVSQAVSLEHPNAIEFLDRDIRNIYRFFREEVGLDIPSVDEIKGEVFSCLKREVGLF
ncbi:MAG: serine protein kinase RIO [Thermoprotei archaeon]|nr:MAG: serine protein kinase RIO [Thermoprotei archaeon]